MAEEGGRGDEHHFVDNGKGGGEEGGTPSGGREGDGKGKGKGRYSGTNAIDQQAARTVTEQGTPAQLARGDAGHTSQYITVRNDLNLKKVRVLLRLVRDLDPLLLGLLLGFFFGFGSCLLLFDHILGQRVRLL